MVGFYNNSSVVVLSAPANSDADGKSETKIAVGPSGEFWIEIKFTDTTVCVFQLYNRSSRYEKTGQINSFAQVSAAVFQI